MPSTLMLKFANFKTQLRPHLSVGILVPPSLYFALSSRSHGTGLPRMRCISFTYNLSGSLGGTCRQLTAHGYISNPNSPGCQPLHKQATNCVLELQSSSECGRCASFVARVAACQVAPTTNLLLQHAETATGFTGSADGLQNTYLLIVVSIWKQILRSWPSPSG